MIKPLRISIGALAVVMIAGAAGSIGFAQSSGDPSLQHPKIVDSASLSGARAEEVYQAIRGLISGNYAASGDPVALSYQTWKRYNKTPYRSSNYGERFVNNYANDTAAGYGKFENLDPLPAGSIIIKDSFAVTRTGSVMTGPLFMMEKINPGFAPDAGISDISCSAPMARWSA